MITTETILKLKEIAATSIENLRHEQLLLLLSNYPKLQRESNSNPDLKELTEKLFDPINNFFKLLENGMANFLEQTLAEADPFDVNLPPITYKNIIDDFDNPLVRKLNDLPSFFTLPSKTDMIGEIQKKRYIPYEYIHLVMSSQTSFEELMSDTVLRYFKLKNDRINKVTSDAVNLRRNLYQTQELEVIKQLNERYPLSLVNEAKKCNDLRASLHNEYEDISSEAWYFDEHFTKDNFAKRLTEQMNLMRINTSDLSRNSDISRETIHSFKEGTHRKKFIHLITLRALARVLRCTPDYLFGKVDTPSLFFDHNHRLIENLIYSKPSVSDSYDIAIKKGLICKSAINKLLDSEKKLLPDDFKQINELIDSLIRKRG